MGTDLFTMLFLWCVLYLVVPSSFAALHPISPCPSIFHYEGTQPENERWYGVVLLDTEESLVGVRIDIRLDRRAEVLVSWMGTVTTEDNERFTILSLDQKLHPGPPTPSRLMVKFNPVKGPPQVQSIRLNGRQICPPDPNFSPDAQTSGQDHLYENRYTTERVTRRPDPSFEDDWTNSRPQVNPSRAPSPSDSYKPPRRESPVSGGYGSSGGSSGGNSGGGYGSSGGNGGSNNGGGYGSSGGNSGSNSGGTYGSSGGNSGSNSGGTYGSSGGNSGSNSGGGYGSSGGNSGGTGSIYQKDKPTGSHGYNSYTEREPTRSTTYSYDSHETYHNRPSGSSSIDANRPGSSGGQSNNRPVNENAYVSPDTSINININPAGSGYNSHTSGGNRPSNEREPTYTNNVYPKTTEKYHEENPGNREDVYVKPTTKKPVVVNTNTNVVISIHTNDDGSVVTTSGSRTTTKRPYGSSSDTINNNNNSRQTTSRPTYSDNQRPSNTVYQNRPNRNPEISSSESQYKPGYGQNNYGQSNNDRTTEKNYANNNNRPSSNTENSGTRPVAIPSNRPYSGNDNQKIPRPPVTSGQKHGDDGDLMASNSNIKCGQVAVNPAPLITHGQNTARGQWPWHIALYRIEGINLSYSCGGSLVSPTVVITAAHCVTKAPRDRPVDADILVVQLGKYHLYQFSDDSVQNKQVRDVHVHPSYNSSNYLDDVAILILSTPAEYTKFVRPVCLWPKHNFNLPNIDNKEGTVVGWGYDENNQVTEELKMARMPVVSYVTCLKSYPQFFSQFTAENKTFCAGFRQGTSIKGTSVCNGDSGGGMVFQQDGVWYLRGLVSITVAKQGLRVCDTNHYVVFTDISNYLDWIAQYL
ncbi:serine proteinase stubble-like isoform X2 [Macrosteles quadrilineatus]|uniref:serine proteinase stubble-like isoform X2 n=1 Tax=Macrosteles quadrilineatus TaxID=74068 RepID=UPI0023E246E2|nr:serine proteinase stubble-like isoform X2 [Macrosteles quadrilineatus]